MAIRGRSIRSLTPEELQFFELALAERGLHALDHLLRARPLSAETLRQLVGHLVAADRQKRQSEAANAKHSTHQKARAWVCKHCEKNRRRYASKIAYATDASALVVAKFGISVKPTTIARDWLPGGLLFGKWVELTEAHLLVSGGQEVP